VQETIKQGVSAGQQLPVRFFASAGGCMHGEEEGVCDRKARGQKPNTLGSQLLIPRRHSLGMPAGMLTPQRSSNERMVSRGWAMRV